tara:strand:+ start:135 stop:299 length:165 start_codon:yes stop_codon:yes gene_type:complete
MIKLIDNRNGTWSIYHNKEKRFIIENGTEKECKDLKKFIDKKRRDENALHRGVR